MGTIAGANTTTLTETIPTESINGLVLPPANLIRVYQAITWQAPARGAKMIFPQIVAAAVTGTQTETDEFTATDLETVKEEISPAMIGKRSFHSDQVDLEGSILTPQARVNAMADEVENRIDKDVLGLFVGATGSDNSGANLSLDLFDAALGVMPGSGLGLAIWRGMTVGAQYFPSRQGTDITVSAYLGAGITADNNIWSFFSKKAA
jgi:hypothetical protein